MIFSQFWGMLLFTSHNCFSNRIPLSRATIRILLYFLLFFKSLKYTQRVCFGWAFEKNAIKKIFRLQKDTIFCRCRLTCLNQHILTSINHSNRKFYGNREYFANFRHIRCNCVCRLEFSISIDCEGEIL